MCSAALLCDEREWKTISAVPALIMLRILNGPVIAIQYRDECKGQCYTDPIYSLNIKQSAGIGSDHK